ncbi:hypothetical protein GCM10028862_15610 [Luteimonas pelagia]
MSAQAVPLSPSRIAALMRAYLDADYRWESAGRWHALQVGARAPGPEAAFPEATRFGLITAWNPNSVERDEATNRAEDAALSAMLDASGLAYRPAFAAAPNRSWREPSWLVVDMALPTFDAIARRFGQLGTLHWARGEPVELRMHADRPPGIDAPAWVRWLGARSRPRA